MDAIIRQGGAEVRWLAALKVGALTRRTGLSVRTLHCYDEIVRFSPSQRTDSGHRLYTAGDIVRPQQIKSLRHVGSRLRELRERLDRPDFPLQRVTRLTRRSRRRGSSRSGDSATPWRGSWPGCSGRRPPAKSS